MNQIEQLQTILNHAKRIVFFTGAGVSTDSGIPDFRSTDGLYNMEYDYPPEEIISHSFFLENPKEFYRFYKNKMIYEDAQPSMTHEFIAKCEAKGISLGVITQNIDGLHTEAGSKHVVELHGSVLRNNCMKCGKFHPVSSVTSAESIPICECGGIIKPDVVLYEEALNNKDLEDAVHMIMNADVMIVLGTSLTVYPAAGLIRYFQGSHLVIINKSTTRYDQNADLCINASLKDVLSQIKI
ncbi:MAG: NAD-dependent protein deacylase [Erysipelotrichaceae bacterium]|nr:NAD-dependent protein deacylase [Erysipelotrichaceae bacterium]